MQVRVTFIGCPGCRRGRCSDLRVRVDELLADKVETFMDVAGTTMSNVTRDPVSEHVEGRRRDPEFQAMVQWNLQHH